MVNSDARGRVRDHSVGASILLIGALATGAVLAAQLLVPTSAKRNHRRRVETMRDKTLKDSFPASDPPASQYFDIPSNRQ